MLNIAEGAGRRGQAEKRQFYVVDSDGRAIATATAWLPQPEFAPERGRLHWVAVRPSHQRLGVASALVSTVCRTFAALGHTGAYLTTGAESIPAIRLYLSLGFRPAPRDAAERRVWKGLAASLP